ncbi:unnamed protein product [Acanthoscelides obtectus]|uniref:RyR/IP3R Homology associated domain-containing protein n=1 Tax=Acanthoscelides obtectus TaxID=200917 RepID=A0A9P0L7N8_ACAOB|nr:unnamed protein product [Acanthoscelides obtectus]CAK1627397.1 Inositol 1,4,5-trisphosphate receptor [Acanthoscelides obtectus]
MYNKLLGGDISQAFFRVFHDKMRDSQQEIKSTVTVNTSEMAAKAHEDKQNSKDLDKISKKQGGKSSNLLINSELQKDLTKAAELTGQAYAHIRNASGEDPNTTGPNSSFILEDLQDKSEKYRDRDEQNGLSNKILIMQPILRFLQLLCENHNSALQNLLRNQNNKSNFNLVSETLMFLDCICGSTTGGLGLLGLYINEGNVALINQTLETLTEYCQGPCHENQNCIATHESNGLDIIIALILNDINPLGKTRMDLVLELKNNASKLLLAIMESRGDSENAERILYNMNPKQLVDVACNAFHQETDDDVEDTNVEDGVSPRDVGHNIWILCHQLAQHNKELASLLKPSENGDPKTQKAVAYYASHTAQIEIVRQDRTLEQIVFPIPEICEYLTQDTKIKVLHTAERDDQEISRTVSLLIWVAMLCSSAIVATLPRQTGIRTLVASTILRLIYSVGPEPTLCFLGAVTIILKGIHLVSIMGNHGTVTKTYQQILTDAELLYHVAYLVFCMLGLVMHPFFYSVLVSRSFNKRTRLQCDCVTRFLRYNNISNSAPQTVIHLDYEQK